MKKYQFICPQCGNTFETDSLVTIHSNIFWKLCKFCQDKYKRTVFNKTAMQDDKSVELK